jgi:hypothetical protein
MRRRSANALQAHSCFAAHRLAATLLAALSLCLPAIAVGQRGVQIDAAFPGGNIVVERIAGDDIFLHQDLRETEGNWFYWCFRVRGAAGRTLTFHFTQTEVIGARGPALSMDGGRNWKWLGPNCVQGRTFAYPFPRSRKDTLVSVGMNYTERNWRDFLRRLGKRRGLQIDTLCRTTKGRRAECIRVGQLDGSAAHRVALTARHHACEMMASYELEGIMEAVLADDAAGKWLRQHVEFLIVPFMDKDGVEEGLQGKNRLPHDPNRDYQGESLYPTVAALKARLPAWSGGKLRLAVDLHCPGLKGAGAERIHFVGGPDAEQWERVGRFCSILARIQTGPLPYRPEDNVPHGQAWNTLAEPKSFGRWAAGLPGIRFATTVELPYASALGREVNAESARAFGRDLAHAIQEYLNTEVVR